MKTTVLGLGLMGAAIALRLHRQGIEVTGWNRSRERSAPLAAAGLPVADDPRDALFGAEVALLVLSDAPAIESVLFAPDVVPLLAGRVILQMGTIAPDESRRIAVRVAQQEGQYLEAPVLGSLPEAESGNLIVMAGGGEALFQRCVPLLRQLGKEVRHIGNVGQGAALKLAMNQLIAGLTATFSLSLGLVRAEGIEVDPFMALLRESALYAPTFDKKLSKYLGHDYAQANFPLKHLLKDVRLFRRVGEPLGIDTAMTDAIAAACERGIRAGRAEEDYSALYEALVAPS